MANEHVEGAAKKAGGFLAEFKEFALKGNVMDMAVGVIIGGAFQSIVTSLTTSFINPLIAVITGGAEKDPETGQIIVSAGSWPVGGVEFTYGAFISAVVNFLIIAFILFLIIKATNAALNLAKKEEEEAPAPDPEPTKEELLLTEIRDLLKEKK